MPTNPLSMNEIFASDLLGVQMNAATLNGLTANSFMRRDQTTTPTTDNAFDLGSSSKRWRTLYISNLNITDPETGQSVDIFEFMMQRNKHNNPTRTDTFDLGSAEYRWRNIYASKMYTDAIYIKDPNTNESKEITLDDLKSFLRYDKTNLPTKTNAFDFGSTSLRWRNAFFNNVDTNSATFRAGLTVNGGTVSLINNVALTSNGAITTSGDIKGNIITASNKFVGDLEGTSLRAKYADVAERYTCKNLNLPVGTLVSAAENEEYDVEVCDEKAKWLKVIGIVSDKPAFTLNSSLEKGITVGLVGKVPVRVQGQVKSGDILIPSITSGVAEPIKYFEDAIYKIAVAIESNSQEDEKLVMCILS